MKKHFLLLLMAFFSLTGWAADLSKGTIIAPSPYYGTALTGITPEVRNEAGTLLASGTDYTLDGYFSDANCTNEVTFNDVIDHIGDTYYIKVTGINLYENSLIASFKVKKMPLTVTFTPKSKTYLENDPEPAIASVKDDNDDDAPTDIVNAIVITREEGNTVKWNAAGDAKLSYAYIATLDNDKYSIKSSTGGLTINPKHFTEATVTVTATANLTYNGAAQKATVTVKDNALNQNLAETTDFVITWSNNTAASDAAKASVKAATKGNYDATDAAIEKTFSIKKAPLLVTPNPTKVYDGTATMPTVASAYATAFSYQGFVDDKTAANVTVTPANVTWALAEGVTASPNVGEYAAVITSTEGFALDNYRFVAQPGTFKITEKETLKVRATSYTGAAAIEYGAAENFAFTVTEGYVDNEGADLAALNNAIEIVKSEEPGEDTYYTLTPTFKTEAKINASTLTDVQKAAAIAAVKNYKLLTANLTIGKLEYKNAALMIALKESAYESLTKVYDGQPVSVTLNKESGLIISPATATVDLSELKLTVVDNSANVGTYRLELSGAKATNYDITYVPSRYKITPRPLSVNIYDQTFVKATVPALNADLFTVADPGEGTGLVTGEKAGDVFQLALDKTEYYTEAVAALVEGDPTPADYKEFVGEDAAGATLTATEAGNYNTAAHLPAAAGDKKRDGVIGVDADGKISATFAAGTYNNAIIAIAASAKFANYNIMATNGKAVILGEAIVLNDAAAITTTAQENATVNFSARSLQTEKWNPLVLPFAVSVEKLSKAFGYAVIDVLNDEKGTDGNVYFKLKVSGTIPANTPFLIYPSDTKTDLNQVVFTEVNVVAVTGEENVSVADAGGNKFWGTYKSTPIWGQSKRYMSKGTWYDARNYTEASPAPIKPLRGYLELPEASAARAIIFIDEPDGTTTAIKAITGDKIGSDIKADGWYTIGGMKLQGAPTQKGIYINNGKKVVVR